MKTLIAAAAATFFAAGVSAHDIYGGLADGNSDLFDEHQPTERMTAVQPSVGDTFDRYQGWAEGNPDLFKGLPEGWVESQDPQPYQGFSGNPDISY